MSKLIGLEIDVCWGLKVKLNKKWFRADEKGLYGHLYIKRFSRMCSNRAVQVYSRI